MKEKSKSTNILRWLFAVRRGVTFFLLMAFVVTCCMLLFLNIMTQNMGITLKETDINLAAQITFGNVVLISIICTIIDKIRRKFMIDVPVRRIADAAERVMKGDFSVRIQPMKTCDSQNGFNVIIDYFNRMTNELSGIETLRTDFIANVSHELKTPLAVIQNYGTLLQQNDLSEEKRMEYAEAVTETSNNLANLITNILKLNKLENQEIYPDAADYDLGEQLCECLLMFEDSWEQKSLEVETDIEENVIVNADAKMLSLVWNNLFSNAVKFTGSGGTIFVSLKSEGDFAVVKVSDTGCGIGGETGRHIFEKFYQGDISHSTKGNGLGLALVKRVIDITGSDIAVESELGRGSTFTVKINRRKN